MSASLKILIAEDEVNIALAIKTIVNKALNGVSITVVNNGIDAYSAVKETNFHLIISDWNMPQMTGLDLLTKLRSREASREIPFLMLTARDDKDSVVSAIKDGVTAYISKPFEKEFIIKKVKELMADSLETIDTEYEAEDKEDDDISIESLSTKLRNGEIDFPVFPAVGMKALELTKSDNVTIKELSDLIKQDTSLTSKLLTIANSSYYGCDRKLDAVEEALLLIGIENANNIILTASNKSLYSHYKGVIGDRLNKLLEHSFTTASCAKVIARKLNLPFPDRFFALALIHDIGKLALLTVLGELSKKRKISYSDVDNLLVELHVEFGTSLVTDWEMSNDFIDAVSNHHNLKNLNKLKDTTQVVALADILVRRIGKSLTAYDKNDHSEQELATLLNINEDMILVILHETEEQLEALK